MYGHVITKFSLMGRLLHFLTHGAPLARLARESSAIKLQQNIPLATKDDLKQQQRWTDTLRETLCDGQMVFQYRIECHWMSSHF